MPEAQGGLPPGPRVLYVLAARTSHGRTVRTAYRGTPGKDHLVTGGLYKWLRHPNYTGEVFGWSASFAAALIAGAAAAAGGVLATTTTLLTNPWIGASALGWLGIMFVLAGEASVGLEKKQKAKYGGQPEYEAWLKGSWAGPVFDPKKSA